MLGAPTRSDPFLANTVSLAAPAAQPPSKPIRVELGVGCTLYVHTGSVLDQGRHHVPTAGSPVVTKSGGVGWLSSNRGRGDVLRLPGPVDFMITAVVSDNELRLASLPTANYNAGTSSPFRAPNVWSAGTITQDFSQLRAAIPEPSTVVLLLSAGLAVLLAWRWRR